jgi:ectoine hydroxylase-related dioxygenase (phytanoyl-CoA dioxygenase family)
MAACWYAEGVIPSTFSDLPFSQRAAHVVSYLNDMQYLHFDIALPNGYKLTEDTPIHLSESVFNLLTHSRLLDYVEMFIGSEIYVNPIQHVRIKPPQRLNHSEKPNGLVTRTGWHQDQGVARPNADQTDMLTVWIAITDATEENGCLCVIPGSHRAGLVTHCTNRGVVIPQMLLESEGLPVPIRKGSAIFMHRLTKHASLSNESDEIRWSFDLRYQPVGQPTGREEFPGFIARSRANPESVITDHHEWADLWRGARSRLSVEPSGIKSHRWTGNDPTCA